MNNTFPKNSSNLTDSSESKTPANISQIPTNINSKNITFSKPFKSRYINDTGKWSKNAVDEGMVDFDDYISDIEKGTAVNRNFNNKVFTASNQKSNAIQNNQNNIKNNSKLNDYSLADTNPTLYASFPGFVGKIKDKVEVANYWVQKGKWTFENLGVKVGTKAFEHSNASGTEATEKAKQWNLNSTWNNKADAYRHFVWNAKMTRDSEIGYYNARNITNRYEYENMKDNNWLSTTSDGFDYLKDNTTIVGKMNQEMFMDLWNNQVGRELANNKEFKKLSIDELFDFAEQYGLLITDANNVYNFLGITDYVDLKNYTVDVEWNLTTGNILVKKGKEYINLKIGL